ncbi:hypothetical protein CI109_106709 [Kwoniella shandongensis]|uniref:Major facilitator superfamily (MFS) profile domain-containing protein n=1 Tax=Kwoniella shandongensis TaxID=1734106 RepID=A0AAJ8LNY1_9TREE
MNNNKDDIALQDYKDDDLAVVQTEDVTRDVDALPQVEAIHKGVTTQLKSQTDMMTIRQTVSAFRRTVAVCVAAGVCAALDGYQYSIQNSIIANKGFIRQMAPKGKSALDPVAVSTFGGLHAAGNVVGQFLIQYLSDWLGRIAAMWMCLATLALYISEHAPSRVRGLLIVAYSMWYSFGILMGAVALKVHRDADPYDWKSLIYSQFAMIGAIAVVYMFLPETPWYLVGKGKLDKCRKTLNKLNAKVPGYDVEQEIGIMAATIEVMRLADIEGKRANGRFDIFKGLNGKRFLIGSYPKVLSSFVGLPVFSNYSTYFYQLAGVADPFLATVIQYSTQIVAVALDASLVDFLGRRRMTMIGFTGVCCGMLMVATIGCFNYSTPELGAALVFAGVTANFFNNFQTSTAYAYLNEMPEQRFRARGSGWGLAYCNLYSVMFNFVTPLMLNRWNVRAAWLFVCTGIPGTVLAFFIMPESSRRSPAEIQELFVDHVPLRKWRGYKTNVERDLEERIARGEIVPI